MLEFQEIHVFVFRNTSMDQLSEATIAAAGERSFFMEMRSILSVRPVELEVDAGVFAWRSASGDEAMVGVVQEDNQLMVSSNLQGQPDMINESESTVLTAIFRREELGVFYRSALRQQKLQQAAAAYGLEHEPDLDRYLSLVLTEGRLTIQPCLPGLLPITSLKLQELGKQAESHRHQQPTSLPTPERTIIVFSRHK